MAPPSGPDVWRVVEALVPNADHEEGRRQIFNRLTEDTTLYLIVKALLEREATFD